MWDGRIRRYQKLLAMEAEFANCEGSDAESATLRHQRMHQKLRFAYRKSACAQTRASLRYLF